MKETDVTFWGTISYGITLTCFNTVTYVPRKRRWEFSPFLYEKVLQRAHV